MAFRQGPVERAAIVSDVAQNGPENWLEPFWQQRDRLHVALFVWEGDPAAHAGEVREELIDPDAGLAVLRELRGRRRAERDT